MTLDNHFGTGQGWDGSGQSSATCLLTVIRILFAGLVDHLRAFCEAGLVNDADEQKSGISHVYLVGLSTMSMNLQHPLDMQDLDKLLL